MLADNQRCYNHFRTHRHLHTHIFTYLHSEEILTFTAMAKFLADHPARREIVPSLTATRRRELEADMEEAEMRALQADLDADRQLYPSDSD